MRFSERYGHKPLRDTLQFESMDEVLRTRLWNLLKEFLVRGIVEADAVGSTVDADYTRVLLVRMWDAHLKRPYDTLPRNPYESVALLREYFLQCAWHGVYDLLEFVAAGLALAEYEEDARDFISRCNAVMEAECSGYRFVGTEIAPITSEGEMQAIEEVLEAAVPLHGVHAHLKAALAKLSDRANPDYRNSVKESISAVEALAKLITRDESASLGEALPKIERALRADFHPALRGALGKLYAWASNEGGIRHGMVDEPNVGLPEAKFMLVACSAFVNYLVAKCADAGVNLTRA
jgi:hypothetical protein